MRVRPRLPTIASTATAGSGRAPRVGPAHRGGARPSLALRSYLCLCLCLCLGASACVSAPGLGPSGPATASLTPSEPLAAPAEPPGPEPDASATSTSADPRRDASPRQRGDRPRKDRGPTDPRFALLHYAGGVAGTLVFSTMSYAVARGVATQGQGLGPVIGALVIGAFGPPILNTTVAWALGRTVAPRRDRFWPAFLVRQVVHLGVFAGAVVGGVDFNKPGHFAAMVVGEAFATSGLATMTAELARRPLAPASPAAPASAAYPIGRRPIEILVPIVEVQF